MCNITFWNIVTKKPNKNKNKNKKFANKRQGGRIFNSEIRDFVGPWLQRAILQGTIIQIRREGSEWEKALWSSASLAPLNVYTNQ